MLTCFLRKEIRDRSKKKADKDFDEIQTFRWLKNYRLPPLSIHPSRGEKEEVGDQDREEYRRKR